MHHKPTTYRLWNISSIGLIGVGLFSLALIVEQVHVAKMPLGIRAATVVFAVVLGVFGVWAGAHGYRVVSDSSGVTFHYNIRSTHYEWDSIRAFEVAEIQVFLTPSYAVALRTVDGQRTVSSLVAERNQAGKTAIATIVENLNSELGRFRG